MFAATALGGCAPSPQPMSPSMSPSPSGGPDPSGGAGSAAFDPTRPVATQAEALRFDTITPFLKFADAYGDRSSGEHGTLGIIPGRMASPSHLHSAPYHGVVIRGVVTDGFNGEANPPRLTPGSYWYVPGNAVHITACVSDEPCLFYTHSEAKFDFAPAEPKQMGLPMGAVEKPGSEFKFDTITPFLQFADAYGNRASGGHGTFGVIPGKTASPSHTHHAAYHGIVIQGRMTDGFNHEPNPPTLGPGSYWYVPADVVHITACVSDTPCLFYTHSGAKFDFQPAP
jgi:quercetin dioxygenase-like cupin family protein